MYAQKSAEQGPHRGSSFDSVNSEAKPLNNEVRSTNDVRVLCFFEKLHLKEEWTVIVAALSRCHLDWRVV